MGHAVSLRSARHFRGGILAGVLLIVLQLCTVGLGSLVWAFLCTTPYTRTLPGRGRLLAAREGVALVAKARLGVA